MPDYGDLHPWDDTPWLHFKYRFPRFLTSLDADYADLLLEAAGIEGFDIEIRDCADEVTREVGNTVAVYTAEPGNRDHSPLWETFHELCAPMLEYGWCRYCELAEATGPDQLCDGCRGCHEDVKDTQPERPLKQLLARIGDKLGLWAYAPSLLDDGWWCVIPTYRLGLDLEGLEKLFPDRAVPF